MEKKERRPKLLMGQIISQLIPDISEYQENFINN